MFPLIITISVELAQIKNTLGTVVLRGFCMDKVNDIQDISFYMNIIEQQPDIIYRYSINNGGIYFSKQAEKVLGYKLKSLYKNPFLWAESIYENDKPVVKQAIENFKQGKSFDINYRIKTKSNGLIWLRDRSINKIEKDGDLIIEGIASDITEKVLSEIALTNSELKYRSLIDSLPMVSYVTDLKNNGTVTFISPQIYDLIGFTQDDYLSDKNVWLNQLYPEDKDLVLKQINYCYQSGVDFQFEYRMLHKDGSVIWVRDEARVIEDSSGKALFLHGFMYNISDKKLSEEKIKFNEAYYKGLFQNMSDGVIVYQAINNGEDFIIKDINKAGEKIVQSKINEIFDKSINDIFSYVKEIGLLDTFKRVYKTGKSEVLPLTLYSDSKTNLWLEYKIFKINNNRIVSVFQDITHRKKIEDEKIKLINKLNERVKEINCMYSVSEALFKNNNPIEAIIPDIVSLTLLGFKNNDFAVCNILLNGELYSNKTNLRPKYFLKEDLTVDDTILGYLEVGYSKEIEQKRIETIFTENEKKLLKKIASEITRKYSNDLLNKQINQLGLAVEQSTSVIVITDLKGNIEYVNKKFLEITGYSKNEVLGKNPRILSSGDKTKNDYKELWQTISSGKIWKGEFLNKKKNGTLYWESATISPIIVKQGTITSYLAIKEDITELKKAQDELIEYKNHLEEMVKTRTEELSKKNKQLKVHIAKEKELTLLKNEFTNNVNHELRNPLTSILLSVEILKEHLYELDHNEIMDRINSLERSAKRLLKLIEELLDLSRLEAEKMFCNLEFISIKKIFNELSTIFSNLYDSKEVRLFFNLESDLVIYSDKEHLIKIFSNLLSNSFKFTHEGYVEVSAVQKNDFYIFKVKDTGVGIEKEDKKYIFERFTQGKNKRGNIPGTGIGLNIVKSLTEKHGGKISLRSEVNKGTTITIKLPLESKWKIE